MDSDLIRKSDILERIDTWQGTLMPRSVLRDSVIFDVLENVNWHIDDVPTVDAAPVVHGEWEQCFEDWRKQIEGDKCSACGFEHYGAPINHYHYCPNCGADMREGRWKGEGMGDFSCSLCGEVVSGNHREKCPNCHAKMDGGDK